MTKHTPEPWVVIQHPDPSHCIPSIQSSCSMPKEICTLWDTAVDSPSECIANADRILTCINALAGIEDPAAFVARAMQMEDIAEAVDGEVYERYSGRDMRGRECVGIKCDSRIDMLMRCGEIGIASPTLDSLGKGCIAYWPAVQADAGGAA